MDTCPHKKPVSLAIAFFYAGTLIISLTTFRPVATFFNGSDTLYLLAAVLLVLRLLYEGQSLMQVFVFDNPFFKPLLMFIFGASLSLINSSDVHVAVISTIKYIFFLGIWLPTGIYLLNTRLRIKWMLAILVAAAMLPIIPAIGDFYFNTRMTISIDRLLSMNLVQTIPEGGRFGSVMGHPNNFGYMIVVVYPISLWMIFFYGKIRAKSFGLLFLCLLLTSNLITASRSTAIAMAIQTFSFIAFMPQRTIKQKASFFIFIIMLFGGVITVAVKAKPVIIVDRFVEMATYELGEYEPDTERIDFMLEAWQAIRKHPIAGIGVDHTSWSEKSILVHNTILRLWAAIGICGLFFSSWIYYLGLHTAIMNLKNTINVKSQNYGPISLILFVSFIGWFFVDMVQPQLHDRFKFIIMILIFALPRAYPSISDVIFNSKKKSVQTTNA